MLGTDPSVGTDLLAPTFGKPMVIDARVRDAILSKVAPNTAGRDHGLAIAMAVKTLRAPTARNVNSAQWRLLMLGRQIEQTLPGLYSKAGAWDFDYMVDVREVLSDTELAETISDATQRALLLQALAGTPDELTGIVLRGGPGRDTGFAAQPLRKLLDSDVAKTIPLLKKWVVFSSDGFPVAAMLATHYADQGKDDLTTLYVLVDQRTKLRGVDDVNPKAVDRLSDDLLKRVMALPRTDLALKGTLHYDAWRVGEDFP